MIKLRGMAAALTTLALLASGATTALATDEVSPQPIGVFSIEGMHWILTGQVVDGELEQVPDGVLVSLRMDDGQGGGNGGCNSYSTSYEIDGFDVTFGEVASTLMACPEPASAVESTYFANLGQVASYQSGGIQMAFLDADGNFLLEFDLAPEATIVGAWVATGINNQQEPAGVVSSDMTSQVTAEFSPGGDLTGSDGCNDYFTTYQVDGDSITISDAIGSTRMACLSDELAEQSQWYFGAITSATTWSVDAAGNLELRDADGALQVSYAPAA